jgi:radical SAM superfamily enzyme YgiQ (UPF0313 family)
MANVILLGDCAGLDFVDKQFEFRYFIKNSALLRLSHFLRRYGHTVFQVHHFTSFTSDELIKLLTPHLTDNTKILGLSSSFISAVKILNKNTIGQYLGTNIIPLFKKSDLDRIINLLSFVKLNYPHIKIVIGGHNIFKQRFNKNKEIERLSLDILNKYVDYFIQGEGEAALLKIINNEHINVLNINGFNIINGNSFKNNDFSEIANAPIEKIDGISFGESLSTELGHGCIFDCEFCSGRITGKNKDDFMRSYESLYTELTYNYKTFGTKFYLFLDDIINDNSTKLEWLIKIRKETNIDITWTCYTRLDLIKSPEEAQMFLDAGCLGVYFGIESINEETGPSIGKITNREKVISQLKMCRQVWGDNILIKASFIAGLPKETQTDFVNNLNYIINTTEGQYLIDRISITPLFIHTYKKGKFTKQRNYPFAQYKLDEYIDENYIGIQNWVSPWGTREQFFNLIGQVSSKIPEQVNMAHPFYFPMYETLGLNIRQMIKSVRNRTFTHAITSMQLLPLIHNKIKEYKQHMFTITNDDVEKYHLKFWETFPIIKKDDRKYFELIQI